MATLKQNLQELNNIKTNIATTINNKGGDVSIDDPFDSYVDAIVDLIPKQGGFLGEHVDENGIWHKPSDWPDIESLECPDGLDTVYLLFGNHVNGESFALFGIDSNNSGWYKVEKGVITNGEFVPTELVKSGIASTDSLVAEWLEDKQDDYTIYRIQGEYIKIVKLYNSGTVTINGINYARIRTTCLMRYGKAPHIQLPYCGNEYIESDNIIDLGKESIYTGTFEANRGYQYSRNLQRWRHTGWDIGSKCQSYYNFFSSCMCLSDIDPDLRGFVTSYTTSLWYMFQNCFSLSYVNVSGWDTQNITNAKGIFYNCFNLMYIEGLDTWPNLSKATSLENMFNSCRKLDMDLDLENFAITSACTSMYFTFGGCRNITSLSIKGWNLSNVTDFRYFCSSCYKMRTINMDNITPPTVPVTSAAQMFYYCVSLQEVKLDGWNFSGMTSAGNAGYIFHYLYGCKKLEFKNCTWPATAFPSASQSPANMPCSYIYSCRYMDLSGIDASVFVNSTSLTYYFLAACPIINDFYPPSHLSLSFSMAACQGLTHDSIIRIFNSLDTVTGSQKITMGVHNYSKVNATEIAIATAKGWQVVTS